MRVSMGVSALSLDDRARGCGSVHKRRAYPGGRAVVDLNGTLASVEHAHGATTRRH
jgi:hypothetical protein